MASSSPSAGLDDPHPPAAAAHRRLDDHRIAQRLGEPVSLRSRGDRLVATSEDRNAGLDGQLPGGDLVARACRAARAGADEGDPGGFAGSGELGVLGEEPITRVDRVDVLFTSQFDDRLDVQIASDWLARLADRVRLVGLEPMHREAVFVRVNRDRADAQLVGRAENPNGDLAPVGHQQLANLGHV